jgi:hypothetical protein
VPTKIEISEFIDAAATAADLEFPSDAERRLIKAIAFRLLATRVRLGYIAVGDVETLRAVAPVVLGTAAGVVRASMQALFFDEGELLAINGSAPDPAQ